MDVVTCPGCGEENPARFRLCGFCGTSLAPAETVNCPSCGEENPGRFRLCGFCGSALHGAASPPAPPAPGPAAAPLAGTAAAPVAAPPSEVAPGPVGASEVRKPATFIFVDLKGSTALTERIDQEAMSEIKKRYFGVMAAEIERHGGTIEKYIGDAIMAVFGIPRAHEDDALRAVRAAHGMQQQLNRLNEDFLRFYGVELANRTGVNTGEVVANVDPGANQQLATGDTVNVAARLEQAAPANEILIGETTYDLVRSQVTVEAVEPLELKGKSERVPAYRLVSLRADGESSGALEETPLVGRLAESATLLAAFQAAVASRTCHVATILGDPGVGKTRLVRDFTLGQADDARIVRGRCLPYGDGITFWPLAEVVREAAGIDETDTPAMARAKVVVLLDEHGAVDTEAIVERITGAIGLSATQFPVSELFWGARRFLEALSSKKPVIMVVDDLHWAQPTFLDFLEHVRSVATDAPVLILTTARLALMEQYPDWPERSGSTPVALGPLSAAEAGGLAERLLGGGLEKATRDKIVSAADGNPLFVEQMVSMFVDKGILERVDGRWMPTRPLDAVAVPATIQALLASRLDDLSREERAVVEPASVIGLVFFEPAIAEMVASQVRSSVSTHLGALDQKQFVARDAEDPTEETYRFRHGLIRDATYGSLLKRTRATLHEQFVTWAERVNRERGREQEFEEILGFHLEQSYRYRTELGPLDDAGRELAARAATKLGAAGRRAFARGDLPAAINLLRRCGELLPDQDPTGIDIRIDLAEALAEAGEFSQATTVLEGVDAAVAALADARLDARARLSRIGIELYAEELPAGALVSALADAEAALAVFERAEDHAGAARATRVVAAIHATTGRYEEAADAAELVVAHATRAGDTRLASRAAAGYATVALAGPTPVLEVRDRSLRLLEQVAGDRKAEATILATIAVLEAMLGEFDAARARHSTARTILGELGRSVTSASTSIEGARVEVLAGDLERAERLLRADEEELASLGERYFRSTIVGLLANVLEARGATDEATAYADLTRELADEDDTNSQVLWRAAYAKLLAREGRAEEALAMATEAAALVDATADLDARGDVHADMGLVMARLGHHDKAREHLDQAVGYYEAKGDLAAAALVRRRLDDAG
jgi:class 3 adenylate cyclase/tetratricopeptide (TPR) repeat protein